MILTVVQLLGMILVERTPAADADSPVELELLHRRKGEVRQQVAGDDLQREREFKDDRQAGHVLTSLDVADITARDACKAGEAILSQAALLATVSLPRRRRPRNIRSSKFKERPATKARRTL
mgnify:CR=1 FL=1